MKLSLVLTIYLFAIQLSVGFCGEEQRTWNDASGNYTIKANLIGATASEAVLRDETGRVIRMPVAKLSKTDREVVFEFMRAQSERLAREERERFASFVSKNQWLDAAQKSFFTGLPVEASIGDELTCRPLSRQHIGDSYLKSNGEFKKQIGLMIATERSFSDAKYREEFQRLFREGIDLLRANLVAELLSGDDPWTSAATITRNMDSGGLLNRAWRSELERTNARLVALKTMQSAMRETVNVAGAKLEPDKSPAKVDLLVGEESLIVKIKATSGLVDPVLLIELEKEAEDWSGIDAFSGLFTLAVGIEPETVSKGLELSQAQQKEMYAGQLAVTFIPSIPSGGCCCVDFSALNRHVVGLKSARYKLLSHAGMQEGEFSLTKLEAKVKQFAGKRSLFPLLSHESKYSAHPPAGMESRIYSGSLFSGKGKFVYGAFNANPKTINGYHTVELRQTELKLVIGAMHCNQFQGLAFGAGEMRTITGVVDSEEVTLSGLNPAGNLQMENATSGEHPYRAQWTGRLSGGTLFMSRETPKGRESFSVRWQPDRKAVK